MKINEQGEVQYHKITPSDIRRYRVKAAYKRFMANVDALWWLLRNMWRQ